jgi:hypothetical protein
MKRGGTMANNPRGSGQDVGPSGIGHVGFSDIDKSRTNSMGRRATLPSSLSPGTNSPGKAGGILKKKIGDDIDTGYLKSIKEDY